MSFCSFSRTKVMECDFVHSAGLWIRNDILIIQQGVGYGMTFWSMSRTKVIRRVAEFHMRLTF